MTSTEMEVQGNHLHIGGRSSDLAVKQSHIVLKRITKAYPELSCSILALKTYGDKVQGRPLYSFGGKALWTRELETLLLGPHDGHPKLDMVVHCLKDMPTKLPAEFEVGCIIDRADPRDALVMKAGSAYKSLGDLPEGSIVGTSSVRRSAQLLKNYPHLKFESVRGNVHTRLRKLDAEDSEYLCLILAAAGLLRLDLEDRITKFLDMDDMYYAVGQGALAIEVKKDNAQILKLLRRIEELPVAYCCLAERALMRHLEGGCSVPIGVNSSYDEATKNLVLKAIIVSPDGKDFVEDQCLQKIESKEEAEEVGIKLGDLLVAKGGKAILEAIDFSKINTPSAPPTPSSSYSQSQND